MWNMKCVTILVIIGANGKVTKGLKKNLKAIPGKHSVDSLQKTSILRTSHLIRKVLQSETCLGGGYHFWFDRSTRKKRPVTRDSIIIIIIIIIITSPGCTTFSKVYVKPGRKD